MLIDVVAMLQAIITILLAATAWGLLRFVGQVDRIGERLSNLETKLADCCGPSQQINRAKPRTRHHQPRRNTP